MNQYHYELRRTIDGVTVGERFYGTSQECHRRGDEMATRMRVGVECYAFNKPMNQWQKMGTYRGHYVFTDSFGEDRRMKFDYSSMAPMGKEIAL